MGHLNNFFLLGFGALIPFLLQSFTHLGVTDVGQFPALDFQHSCSDNLQPITFSTRLISSGPLLIYLESFVSPQEIKYLLELGQPYYQRSMITDGKISAERTSDSCFLPGNDTVISAIKRRAAKFLGGVEFDGVEAIQLVRYKAQQKVNLHYDWHQYKLPVDRQGRTYNRLASFFIYLDADCTGGQTWFPNVTVSSSSFDQGASSYGAIQLLDSGKGIAVNPKAGNGVFWMNMENNVGDRRTLHAGLPVASGTKIGMNIWVKKIMNMD